MAAVARFARHVSSFRRLHEKGGLPGSVCAKCMLFALKLAGSSSHVSVFGVQSGDFGYIARESCQGGPFFASRSLESCMGRRSCQCSALRRPLRSGGQNKGPCCVRKGHAHVAFIPSISFPRYEKAEEGGTLAVYGKRPMRSREVSSPFAEELALKSLALPLGW